MRYPLRLIVKTFIVSLLLVSMVGCAAKEPTPGPDGTSVTREPGEKNLRIRLPQDGISWDPAGTTAIEDAYIMHNLYNALTRFKYGSDTEIEPDLATHWEISDDGTVWTFFLREGVQFHHGYGELTAEDVVFTYERNMKDGSLWSPELKILKEVKALDRYTVEFTLREPNAPFLFLTSKSRPFTGYILSKKALEEIGDDAYGRNPIGTGPFMLEEYVPRDHVVLVANPDYWEGPPKLDRITWYVITDENAGSLAVERGGLDISLVVDPPAIERYSNNPELTVHTGKPAGTVFLNMNTTVPPFNDVRVRRAVAHAIDFNDTVYVATAGLGQLPGCGLIQPGMIGYDPSVNVPFTYDPDLAKSLLVEAGYDQVKVEAVTYIGDQWYRLGEAIAEHLAVVGIEFDLIQLERAAMNERRIAPETQAVIVSWVTVPDPDYHLSLHSSERLPPNGNNISRYTEVDDLVAAQRLEVDPARRAEMLSNIQKKFCEDVPSVAVYHTATSNLVRPEVLNFRSTGPFIYWFHDVDLKTD